MNYQIVKTEMFRETSSEHYSEDEINELISRIISDPYLDAQPLDVSIKGFLRLAFPLERHALTGSCPCAVYLVDEGGATIYLVWVGEHRSLLHLLTREDIRALLRISGQLAIELLKNAFSS